MKRRRKHKELKEKDTKKYKKLKITQEETDAASQAETTPSPSGETLQTRKKYRTRLAVKKGLSAHHSAPLEVKQPDLLFKKKKKKERKARFRKTATKTKKDITPSLEVALTTSSDAKKASITSSKNKTLPIKALTPFRKESLCAESPLIDTFYYLLGLMQQLSQLKVIFKPEVIDQDTKKTSSEAYKQPITIETKEDLFLLPFFMFFGLRTGIIVPVGRDPSTLFNIDQEYKTYLSSLETKAPQLFAHTKAPKAEKTARELIRQKTWLWNIRLTVAALRTKPYLAPLTAEIIKIYKKELAVCLEKRRAHPIGPSLITAHFLGFSLPIAPGLREQLNARSTTPSTEPSNSQEATQPLAPLSLSQTPPL